MRRNRSILLAIGIPFALGACSADRQSAVLSPDISGTDAQGARQAVQSTSAWIGPDGGQVSLMGCTVQMPAGALSAPTLITMTRNADGTVELGPHGQTFAVAVQLLFVAPLLSSAGDHEIQWYDESCASWTTIPSYASGFGQAALLEHFSLYRLERKN